MQAGCKQDASTLNLNGIPKALFRAWPHVPEHIQLAIMALISPYLPLPDPGDERGSKT